MPRMLLEGYSIDEILELSDEELSGFVLRDEPIVFKAGSAEMLGKFRVLDRALVLELGHIDGGGEGVLPAIAALANRYALREGLASIEWQVHAVHCAKPNLKLRRVLQKKGFAIREIEGVGECYWYRQQIGGDVGVGDDRISANEQPSRVSRAPE